VAARAETRTPTWQRGKVASWLVTTDHKRIGILYIATSLVFFVLAGLMALVMRLQLAQADADIIGPERYNELVSIHGTSMVFLVGVPILAGFANFLVPLMIGAADVAFPRLNALSYWMFALGGGVIMLSFFAEGGANQAGWTCYPPLCEQQAGNGVDFWIVGLHILTVSTVAGAINFLVTIHNMRTRGMTWTRMPLFVWSIELYSWLIVVVMPVLAAALTMLLLDRGLSIGPWDVQTNFFNPAEGGSALLYQHAFWFFGHPEVYIIVLPAFGIISEVLPVFARKPIFGYKAIVASTVAIGFFSMLVWAHHMFTVGLPISLQSFFMIASMLIAVPTGM
jgi:cytochrome c oxidase subunit 1